MFGWQQYPHMKLVIEYCRLYQQMGDTKKGTIMAYMGQKLKDGMS